MAHKAHVVHHVRGRIRVKLPHAKGNRALLHQIKQSVEPMAGVQHVAVNTATGSMLVQYDSGMHSDFEARLMQHAEERGSFALHPPELTEVDEIANKIEAEAEFLAKHSETARQIVDFVRSIDRTLKRATNNSVDLKVLLPLGLAAYSVLEIGVDASTPMWVTLGIFSFNSFISLHDEPVETIEKDRLVVDRQQISPPASCPPEKPAAAKRPVPRSKTRRA